MSSTDPSIINDSPSSTQLSGSLQDLATIAEDLYAKRVTRGSLKRARQLQLFPTPTKEQEIYRGVTVERPSGGEGVSDPMVQGPPPITITITFSVTSLKSKAEACAIAKNRKPKVESGTFTILSTEPFDAFKAQLLAAINTASYPQKLTFDSFKFEWSIPRIAATPTNYSTEAHHNMALEKLVTRKKPPYELKFHIDEVGPPTPPKASTSSGKRHGEQLGTERVGSSERDGNSERDGGSPPAKKRKLIRGSTLGSDMERARSEEDSLPAGGGDLEPEADKLKKKKKKKDKAREKDSGVPKEAKLSEHAKHSAELFGNIYRNQNFDRFSDSFSDHGSSSVSFQDNNSLPHSLTTLFQPKNLLMDTFAAAEHVQSVNNLGDLNLSSQIIQNGSEDKAKLDRSPVDVRLDRLSNLRIHADAISFSSSQPHGSGGKAEVVKATLKRGDGSGEERVAVKKLRYYDDTNEQMFSNEFVHEVEVTASLSHRNIVKLIGFVEDLQEGLAWIVLSWKPNGNVRHFLETGEWEIPERISLIKDTFAGIEYLHTRQPPICHGDLKSLNILVSSSYRAVITDFGSARILKEREDHPESGDEVSGVASTLTGDRTQIEILASSDSLTLTGPSWSLRWAAPEVTMGELQNLASDIWSAGWICWEIMTNKVPFSELSAEGAIALRVVEGHVPVAREDTQLSEIIRLCSLMMDCWAFDPQNRPNIARCCSEIRWMPSIPPLGGKTSASNVPSAKLLYNMARVQTSQSRYDKAIPLFQQALSAASSSGDQKLSRRVLSGLGEAYYHRSKPTEAEQYFRQAREICIQNEDDEGQAHALLWLGKVCRTQRRLSEAQDLYSRARDIYIRMGDDYGQASTLHGIANIFQDRSQHTEAEEFYDQAREIYARSGHDQGHANTLIRLGTLYQHRSEYEKAEESFTKALDTYSRIGDNLGRANVHVNLGHLYHAQSLNSKAAPFFAEAKDIYAQVGNSRLEIHCNRWLDAVSKQAEPKH